ncbi:5538_t:CDS:2, partial [Gigaspora rosea]
ASILDLIQSDFIRADLPNPITEPELHQLISIYQIHRCRPNLCSSPGTSTHPCKKGFPQPLLHAIHLIPTLELEPAFITNNGSFVWRYFEKQKSKNGVPLKDGESFVKCSICNKLLKYADDSSTSNRRKHLKHRTHISKVPELDNNKKRSNTVLDLLKNN